MDDAPETVDVVNEILNAQAKDDVFAVLRLPPPEMDKSTGEVKWEVKESKILSQYKKLSKLVDPEKDDSKEAGLALQALIDAHNVFLDEKQKKARLALWRELNPPREDVGPKTIRQEYRALKDVHRDAATEVARMDDTDPDVRWAAIHSLGKIKDGAVASGAVATLLQDDDMLVRWMAAETLSNMGATADKQAAKLLPCLKQSDSHLCRIAIEALGNMGEAGGEHAEDVAELSRHVEAGVRRSVAECLGKMGTHAAQHVGTVESLLKDEEKLVRWAATYALTKMGKTRGDNAGKIVPLLEDPDEEVRWVAVDALVKLGKDALGGHLGEAVAPMLKHADGTVRFSAVEVMGSIVDKANAARYLPLLVKALEDDHTRVRCAAVKALLSCQESLIGDNASAVVGLVRHSDIAVRQAAENVLASIVDRLAKGSDKELLTMCLEGGEVGVCKCVLTALKKMGKKAAEHANAVGHVLQHPEPEVRKLGLEVLGKMGEQAGSQADTVASMLRDGDARVRWAAVISLGGMGPGAIQHVQTLADLLRDGDPVVCRAAGEALRKMLGDQRANIKFACHERAVRIKFEWHEHSWRPALCQCPSVQIWAFVVMR
ncbi:hypothetical protein CYMTET_26923 [Cymbomonas tetramitiformis]|uniref:Uncharacterized protein n=1 Tax=Cymbomonas tetramitiformis TaxID=36881 RepID=A0AAE0FRG9_9CHLO|nr:hypothetical protein CYMTET_26923 [Cymbomonas tetramitiformis]